ncbi:hypothetical protein DFJ74DRAFT_677886 [Hyaloraphidium curvatum]|nr:hypothetical protein DFJ74DRAFT_677886 [Hyaloraphidium curvatum]
MGGDSQGRLPLIVILYGHFSALDSDYVLRFLGDLGNSAWWGISKVYADTKKFVGVPYVAKVFRDPGSQGLNGAKPEKIIKANSPNGYSATALYVILHGTDSQPANLASDNSAFCDSWVGYHSAYQQWTSWFTYTFVKYAVIGHPQACPGYHGLVFTGGPGGMVRDELCSTTAHEISEAATNPHGTYYGFFWSTIKKPAWKDGKGSENADKCLGEFGKYKYGKVGSKSYKYNVLANGRPYLIQTNWDRYRQTCVQGR